MLDLIPQGYLSLREAFEQFLGKLKIEKMVTDDASWLDRSRLKNSATQEFVNAFVLNELRALVKEPGERRFSRLPPDSWTKRFFPERVFLSEAIAPSGGDDDPWGKAVGRTPFLAEAEFQDWLARRDPVAPSKGGAPPKADWAALKEAFQREVDVRGFPEPLNVDGWQRQADVERWIAYHLAKEQIEVSETTLKTHARRFLQGARGQKPVSVLS
jgi:hypothetical protein